MWTTTRRRRRSTTSCRSRCCSYSRTASPFTRSSGRCRRTGSCRSWIRLWLPRPPVGPQPAEDRAAQRRREDEPALRVRQVRLRRVVGDLVTDQDEAAEHEAADAAADDALIHAAVLHPAEEAADDGDRPGHHVIEDLAPAEHEAAQDPEHHRHDDAADHLEPEGALVEERRQLHEASVTEMDSSLPSISALCASPSAPS